MDSRFGAKFEDVAIPMLEQWFSVVVTLSVGTKSSGVFSAIWSSVEYDSVELQTGLPVKIAYKDWLVPVDRCVIDGETVRPRTGNRLVLEGEQYEIVPIPGKPSVEVQDGGYRYLIHSQKVSA